MTAPRDLVFRVSTEPEHIAQWWGSSEYATTVDKADVRPGGQWRYVQRDRQGNEFVFHGARESWGRLASLIEKAS